MLKWFLSLDLFLEYLIPTTQHYEVKTLLCDNKIIIATLNFFYLALLVSTENYANIASGGNDHLWRFGVKMIVVFFLNKHQQ